MLFSTRNGARAIAVWAGLIWGATNGAAATISAFGASVAPSSPLTVTGLTYAADFFAADASISARATCNADITCSGEAIRYIMSVLDVGPQTPISAEFVGNASALTTGSFAWSASSSYIVFVTTPFTLGSGAFDQSILSTLFARRRGGHSKCAFPVFDDGTRSIDYFFTGYLYRCATCSGAAESGSRRPRPGWHWGDFLAPGQSSRQRFILAYFEHYPAGEAGGLVAFEDYAAGFGERHAGLDGALVDGHLAQDFAVGIVFGF